MATPVIVDDQDPRIQYSENHWFLAGSANEYATSTHGSRSSKGKATFTFTGTSIAVYGTISDTGTYKTGPASTYSIDGASPATYSAVPTESKQYGVQFYRSPALADGEHTLVIANTLENAFFWLDYLEYTPAVQASPSQTPTQDPPAKDPVPDVPKVEPEVTSKPPNSDTSTTSPTNIPVTPSASTSILPTSSRIDQQAGALTSTLATANTTTRANPDVKETTTIVQLDRPPLETPSSPTVSSDSKAASPLGVSPFTALTPGSTSIIAAETVAVQSSSSHSSNPSPYPSISHGHNVRYVTHGGTTLEKKERAHRSQRSLSNSHYSAADSSTGLLNNSGREGETRSGEASSHGLDSSSLAGPSRTAHQSYGAGSLYHGPDDAPPAYYPNQPPATHSRPVV
ncbi:hypothetical protein DXG03_006840 [Asterophora parasitica]|uniref:Uncharacterized protein n=1 Tax=Asterophora parasitica TaxID=117018 RepID=A0A9P7GAF4_9AGAR|nr:hypothetical protein DXG03_006840 [Asterophora parasitica]